MNCPVCNVPLTLSERQGIEIDYCPQCRGVWLDRGELDKIVERSYQSAAPPRRPEPGSEPRREDRFRGDEDRDRGDYEEYRHRKRKNWLEELFD